MSNELIPVTVEITPELYEEIKNIGDGNPTIGVVLAVYERAYLWLMMRDLGLEREAMEAIPAESFANATRVRTEYTEHCMNKIIQQFDGDNNE